MNQPAVAEASVRGEIAARFRSPHTPSRFAFTATFRVEPEFADPQAQARADARWAPLLPRLSAPR